MNDLSNKRIIVTGGAKGIGKAIVEEFRKLGAKLVIGRKVEDVIKSLKGIQCRNGTSCPDQLARACEF